MWSADVVVNLSIYHEEAKEGEKQASSSLETSVDSNINMLFRNKTTN